MEDQQPAIFSFNIDETGQAHFVSIAKWNRFMAIVGIVVCFIVFIIIVTLIFGGSYYFSNLFKYSTGTSNPNAAQSVLTGAGAAIVFMYTVLIAIYMVPCFFRLSFSNKMLKAIANTDQEMFNDSLKQLKIYSQYWGILTIIGVGFYALIVIFLIIGFLAGGMRQ